MARSKQEKRKKQQRRSEGFFESLPLTTLPPVLPEVRDQIAAGADEAWHAGQALAESFWTASQQLAADGNSWLHRAMAVAMPYSQAAARDARAGSIRLRRTLWSSRARAIYLAFLATLALGASIVGTLVAVSTISFYASDISSPAAIMAQKKAGVTILDRNGKVLYQGYGAQSNTAVPLSQIPQNLKDATLAAEDPGFYDHPGFSWRATARAAWVDVTHGDKSEGGSTLTQQLVKNSLLTSTKSFERKYQEVLLSMELEQHYSKDEILGMYLNDIDYGQSSRGVEAASETYFHKPVQDLDLSQSAMIAGLPLGTNRFDPNADLTAATQRRDYVLDRMLQLGKITATQDTAAKAEPLVAYPKTATLNAPWFVFYILDQIKQQYGENILSQGITVKTTLDLDKENQAEQIIKTQIGKLADHHVTNGALISMEPGTGDIISMVGSEDYNAPGFGNVNATLSLLQPGSSFKPFAYVTAFMKGWNGATHVDDAPISLPNGDGTMYTPQNYDLQFHGSVSLRHALGNSLNIPAIKVLQYAGIPDTLTTAKKMGITTLGDPSQYGVSLVLGAGDVTPLDMATAYGTFANGGVKVEPRSILQVTDKMDKNITKPSITNNPPTPEIDPRYAYMITNILADNQARQPEFGLNSPLVLSRPAAAKTGTTNDFRDNWTVGYTPGVVTAVWVGNNDHTAMQNVDGISGAAPIWHDYMEYALSGTPVQNFTVPAGDTVAKVCASGGLADPSDTSATDEVFPSNAMPTNHCAPTSKTSSFFNFLKDIPTPSVPVIPTLPVETPVPTPPPGHGKNPFGN